MKRADEVTAKEKRTIELLEIEIAEKEQELEEKRRIKRKHEEKVREQEVRASRRARIERGDFRGTRSPSPARGASKRE